MSLPSNDRIGNGQSTQELNAADWWARHHISLRTMGFGALVAFIALSWGYGIWTLFDAYALSYPKEQRYTARIAGTTLSPDAINISAPQSLQPGGTQSLSPESNLQHLYVPVSNPNALWWANIQYRFRDGTTETPIRSAVLLPNEARVLTELGWQGAALRAPSISIESIEWKRMDLNVVGTDFSAFKSRLLNFTMDKPVYQSNLEIEGKKLGQTSFTFTNPSGYSYRNVELLTTLYREGTVAGMNRLVLPHVAPGSSRQINVVWPENPLGITRVDVQPFVHILDPETFKKADSSAS